LSQLLLEASIRQVLHRCSTLDESVGGRPLPNFQLEISVHVPRACGDEKLEILRENPISRAGDKKYDK
jgi:hypothetical protein